MAYVCRKFGGEGYGFIWFLVRSGRQLADTTSDFPSAAEGSGVGSRATGITHLRASAEDLSTKFIPMQIGGFALRQTQDALRSRNLLALTWNPTASPTHLGRAVRSDRRRVSSNSRASDGRRRMLPEGR